MAGDKDGGQSANPLATVVEVFKGMGLPLPNEVITTAHQAITEVHQANATMQSLAPDLHKMANMADPLRDLATTLKGFTPKHLVDLTNALNGAKETGEKLLSHFK